MSPVRNSAVMLDVATRQLIAKPSQVGRPSSGMRSPRVVCASTSIVGRFSSSVMSTSPGPGESEVGLGDEDSLIHLG